MKLQKQPNYFLESLKENILWFVWTDHQICRQLQYLNKTL